jgi:hypothetical protein
LEPEPEDFCERKTQSRVARAQGWNGTVPNGTEMMYSLILSRPVGLRSNEVQQEYCTRVRPQVLPVLRSHAPRFQRRWPRLARLAYVIVSNFSANLSGHE